MLCARVRRMVARARFRVHCACCVSMVPQTRMHRVIMRPPGRFPNVDKPVRKRLLASCFNYIPTTLTGQFLDSHDSPDGLMNVR